MKKISISILFMLLVFPIVSLGQSSGLQGFTNDQLSNLFQQGGNRDQQIINLFQLEGNSSGAVNQSQQSTANLQPSNLFDPNSGLPSGINEQIQLNMNPEIPSPGESVNVTVDSVTADLDNATITWSLNGAVIEKGIGKRSVTFIAPKLGSPASLSVTIVKRNGGVETRSLSFTPASIDLIYQANTYTPPLYKGKAMFSRESDAKIVAIPNFISGGVKLSSDNLIYKWKVNGTVDARQSGVGRNTYQYQNNILSLDTVVGVEVESLNGGIVAKKAINLRPINPGVVLYEKNPLYGSLYEKALVGNFNLDRPEIEVVAVPYYFVTRNANSSNLEYKWRLNNSLLSSLLPNDNTLVLRNEGDQGGLSNISVSVKNNTKITQSSADSFQLIFDGNLFESEFTL